MTSEPPRQAYVWIWLPGQTEPVVAGRIRVVGDRFSFAYGRSYLHRGDAIPIYAPELPLQEGTRMPEAPLAIASALRDALPDAWGRRVIAYRLRRRGMDQDQLEEIDELAFMLQSGSNRFGALDFQATPDRYMPREAAPAPLEHLVTAAERVERDLPMAPDLKAALLHATSIGGAMPKAQIHDGNTQYIAKFVCSSPLAYNLIKAEYVAMRLAHLAGLDVAPVRLARAMDKDVLLVERFDRDPAKPGQRRAVVSALTVFGFDEMMARYASYADLAEALRTRGSAPGRKTLEELFSRMTFNVLSGNTDDHARNHACFWDGDRLALTPAYDICPQSRGGAKPRRRCSSTATRTSPSCRCAWPPHRNSCFPRTVRWRSCAGRSRPLPRTGKRSAARRPSCPMNAAIFGAGSSSTAWHFRGLPSGWVR